MIKKDINLNILMILELKLKPKKVHTTEMLD